ncbi:MAG TPA: hypothetical protein VES42_13520 [Pilimelia sp.]|nr:hypothetical protein [Pilimelia sp.]
MEPDLIAEVPDAWDRPGVTVPGLAVLALLGGQLPSFSSRAEFYILVLGGTAFTAGALGVVPRWPAPRVSGRGAAWWLLPIALFGAVEGATFGVRSDRYPTLSALFDPVLESEIMRSAFFFGWLAAFWALVRR